MSDFKQITRKVKPRIVYWLHSGLMKPGEVTLHHCDPCGRPIFESNSDTVEISNTFGVPQQAIKPSDKWIRIQCKSCGAKISIFFK